MDGTATPVGRAAAEQQPALQGESRSAGHVQDESRKDLEDDSGSELVREGSERPESAGTAAVDRDAEHVPDTPAVSGFDAALDNGDHEPDEQRRRRDTHFHGLGHVQFNAEPSQEHRADHERTQTQRRLDPGDE